jgi:SAM-dependent methyltransferase
MVSGSSPVDVWSSGDDYNRYVGRWSRLAAQEFLNWLDIPPASSWLDVGCGTGTLSRLILDSQSPISVHGVDSSPDFLGYARSQNQDERAEFTVGDAMDLHSGDETYDAAVAGLVINFTPHPAAAISQMARVTRRGGTVAAYVWDYAGEMQMMRYFWDAAAALSDNGGVVDEGLRFPYCNPPGLTALFEEAGLHNVDTTAIDVPTTFRDFDDYWSPFLGGQGAAPAHAMRQDEQTRSAIREHIRARLPIEADGSIHLIARAWAIRATR